MPSLQQCWSGCASKAVVQQSTQDTKRGKGQLNALVASILHLHVVQRFQPLCHLLWLEAVPHCPQAVKAGHLLHALAEGLGVLLAPSQSKLALLCKGVSFSCLLTAVLTALAWPLQPLLPKL